MTSETALIEAVPVPGTSQRRELATLRETAMMCNSPEEMQTGLAFFKSLRDTFRDWLLSNLIEGIHYGYPPGTHPQWCDERGKPCAESDAWGTIGKKGNVPLSSWIPKKTLYAAGADFLCEVLGARDTYESDAVAWAQAGSQAGMFARKCTLISRANGSILADGTGIASGEHLGHNASLKKADKRAKVAAVLNWLSVRDLFTQDLEDGADRQRHENPERKPDAPEVKPRAEREVAVTAKQLSDLRDRWKALRPPDATREEWLSFVQSAAGRLFDAAKYGAWTQADVEAIDQRLKEQEQ